jgi:hypothetical protein
MRRCPKCNRTYANDGQKFCTKDGTSLIDVAASGPGLGETIRLDSAELRTTQDDPEVTKVISRNLPPPPAEEFDPFKTVISRPTQDRAGSPLTTGDLMASSIPPSPTMAISPPPNSGPIQSPTPPAPVPPQSSGPIGPSGPIGTPSQPLQNVSGDLGQMTMASFAPPPPATSSGQLPVAAAPSPATPKQKSKLPLVFGILAVLLVLGIGVAGAAYWFVMRPMLEARRVVNVNPEPPRQPAPIVENTPSETRPLTDNPGKEVPPYSAPADAIQFVNSKDKLDGKLAEHYVDFSFYYPERWQKDSKAGVSGASNFAKVERRLPPDFTQENFAVGWYSSAGSEAGDRAVFPSLVSNLSAQFAKGFSEYRKVSEGPSKAGPYDGYEFRFESMSRGTDKGDIKIWGRVIFLPPVDGGKNGVTLLMLATSLAPELKSVNDVGVKGELPMMLESFRFGK